MVDWANETKKLALINWGKYTYYIVFKGVFVYFLLLWNRTTQKERDKTAFYIYIFQIKFTIKMG